MQLTSTNDITTRHRHIFLSPHYDDVVYSCGGTLGVQVSSGLRPLVITIFGGTPAPDQQLSPFAQQVVGRMGTDSQALSELRHKEDSAALDYFQSDYLWLDYPEAIFRGKPAYYTQEAALIGGDVNPADQGLDKQIAQLLLDLQAHLPDAVWYAPLGIGRHVDHQIVCSAADRLVQQGAKVYFYEDFPYVTRQAGALEARLQELGTALEPTLVEMSEFLSARQEGSAMYTSQIYSNFGSAESLQKSIESYTHSIRPVETVRLERYWTPRQRL